MISQEPEGKIFRQQNMLQLRVERGDHGATVTCEATHPALPRGQRRLTHYTLDVQCEPCRGDWEHWDRGTWEGHQGGGTQGQQARGTLDVRCEPNWGDWERLWG